MNHLLEKEIEAFRELLTRHCESCEHADIDECLKRDVDYFTQALERVWKAGVEDERDAWIQGLRCVGCGREHDNELSDTCAECFEED